MADNIFFDRQYLTSWADALREATETTEPLVFPDGFNAAISSLTNGVKIPELDNPATETEVFEGYEIVDQNGETKVGTFTIQSELTEQEQIISALTTILENKVSATGFNYSVIGGATQPENPAENTIWVNTDAEISTYEFSADTPFSYMEGKVWIQTADSSSASFNCIKDAVLMVYPISTFQYINGDWVAKDAMLFQNDSWIELCPALYENLEDNSWKAIQYAARKDMAKNYWSIGDTKSVLVNGTIGTLIVKETYYVYILGFDHNIEIEGTGITFGCFKTESGTDIALIDSGYNSTFSNGTKYFNYNHSGNTNAGGWKGCDLRYDILGSTDTNDGDATENTAINPVANTLMTALPADLRAVMKPMTIYSDNNGGGSNTASYVTASVDYLPLLAEFEVFGTRSLANSAEQNYQKQYDYFKAGNSKVKYGHNALSSATRWWVRSVLNYYNSDICFVETGGNMSGYGARISFGIAPIFRVG